MSGNKYGNPWKYMIADSKQALKASTRCGTYQYQSK